MTKKGLRTFDCRAAVVSLTLARRSGSADECAILEVVLRHGTPSVRPDDVLAGLREHLPDSRPGPLLCTSGWPRVRWTRRPARWAIRWRPTATRCDRW